jgi:hypothetical protein
LAIAPAGPGFLFFYPDLLSRLRSSNSGLEDAGTEDLRVALQHYRAFWISLDDLPAQT